MALDLDGEPALVRTLRDLSDVLPLALEEQLAALVGPLAAHGISSAMRALAAVARARGRTGRGGACRVPDREARAAQAQDFEELATTSRRSPRA